MSRRLELLWILVLLSLATTTVTAESSNGTTGVDWRIGIEHTSDSSSILGGTYLFGGMAVLNTERRIGAELKYSLLLWPQIGREHVFEATVRILYEHGISSSLGYFAAGYAFEVGAGPGHHLVFRWCPYYETTTSSPAVELLPITVRIGIADSSPSVSITLLALVFSGN